MRRAPFVLIGTGAGLAAVLGYHTASLSGVASGPGAKAQATGPVTSTSPSSAPSTTSPPSSAPPTSASSNPVPTTGAPTTTRAPTTTTTAPAARRSDGQDVQYRYGELEVQATVKGNRLTDVETVINQGFDPRSEQINQQAVPELRQQVLSAQSTNVDGVSGATYTSEAYVQSLQAALDSLGFRSR